MTSNNPALVPGVSRFSRSQRYARKALYNKKKIAAGAKAAPAAETKTVSVGGAKNGGSRVVPVAKAPRFYPADDVPVPKVTRKTQRPSKLRTSITPGTVLILLAGNFRGRRVVFLKQLESGLLLVTGPYKVNGVPLRRVAQSYVIATSAKVDISGVKIDDKINDEYFKTIKAASKKATAEALLGEGESAKKVAGGAERAADQKAIDSQLIPIVSATPQLKKYLASSFSLSKGQYPHAMKF